MISAKELRDKMHAVVMQNMDTIEKAVNDAADSGKNNTTVTITSCANCDAIVAELENLGYNVKLKYYPGDWRDPAYQYIEISW